MKKFLFTCLVAATSLASVSASIILSDGFNYGVGGDLVGAGGSPWVETLPAATPLVIYTNDMVRVSFQGNQDINAPLQDAPYASGGPVSALYSSFTIKCIALPSLTGSYFAHFKDSSSGFRARIWASTNGTGGPGKFRLGIGNSSTATATSGQITSDLNTNVTYTIVTRFELSTGLSTIWLNPTIETDPSVTASDAPAIIAVTSYAFRQAGGIGANLIDNLKIGTSFADVAGANSPPSISPIATQRIPANSVAGPLAFTIGDIETPASGLTVTAASTNQTLVPNANVVLGGSGSSRTVTVTPAAGEQGVTSIRIGLTDGDGLSVTNSFLVFVGAPTISDVANQITYSNTVSGPIQFTVGDMETAAGSLTVTAESANTTLVPNANIVIGGSDANRTITLTPAPDSVGFTVITISVSDGTQTVIDSFVLTVAPRLGLLRADDFERPNGPLVQFDGQWISNGGTGGSNSQQLQIVGGKIKVLASSGITNTEDVLTDLPPGQFSPPVYATNSGVVLYASMTINLTNLPTMGGDYFAHFRDVSGLGFRGRVYVATTNASTGHYRIGVANAASSIRSSWQIPTNLATNTSYLIVFRYNIATAETYLWLNPNSESSPGVAATDFATLTDVTAFAFRQNAGIGAVCVDDLKVGTSFSDVVEIKPALTITATGNNVTLSWPASAAAAGYVLRFTDSFPAAWADFFDQGNPQGDQLVVTLNGVTDNRFFELRKP